MKQTSRSEIIIFIRRSLSVLIAVLLCVLTISPTFAEEKTRKREVVRVGYPLTNGLTEIDENGNYSGYSYDYLLELSQYTGWEYEFVTLEGTTNEVIGKMYDMLEAGELDLMGATNYSEELDKIFDYSSSHYGSVYSTIEVPETNTSITEANYQTLQNSRIAMMKKAKNANDALEHFCSANKITYKPIYCDDADEMIAAVDNGTADAMLSNDVSVLPGHRIAARFNPRRFYFATSEGNFELMSKINSAMIMLSDSDPYFTTALYQKYFDNQPEVLRFSDDETEYLQNSKTLRVGMANERKPLENISGDVYSGISFDLMKLVASKTGLDYEIVPFQSADIMMNALSDGELDMALGATYDYNSSQKYNFSLTKPYLSSQIIMAAKDGVNPYQLNGKRLALPKGVDYKGGYMGDVMWYDNILQCLEAVNNGHADYCYGNAYSVEYYCSLYRYRHLTLIPQSQQMSEYCIAVSRNMDSRMLTVLNKTIRNIPEGDLGTMIYINSAPPTSGISLGDVVASNPLESISVVMVITFIFLSLLSYIAIQQRNSRCKVQLENERYKLLAELSGEFLFEYDFVQDRLTLSEKTSNFLGINVIHENFYRKLSCLDDANASWLLSIRDSLKNQKNIVNERRVPIKDGEKRWVKVTIAAIDDKNGNASYAIGKVADIEDEIAEKAALSEKAQSDSLTGLYNVVSTKALVGQAISTASTSPLGALFIIDIDHFKSVNDNFGHYTGDVVLQDVSKILRSVFREHDIIGRLGGDEFIVFISGYCDEAIIGEKFQMLQHEMLVHSEQWPASVTLSAGAVIVDKATEYSCLYKIADNVLYEVKANGRNGYRVTHSDPQP